MMYLKSMVGRSGPGITTAWKNAKGNKTAVIRTTNNAKPSKKARRGKWGKAK